MVQVVFAENLRASMSTHFSGLTDSSNFKVETMDEELQEVKMHKQTATGLKSSKMEGDDREYIEAPIG